MKYKIKGKIYKFVEECEVIDHEFVVFKKIIDEYDSDYFTMDNIPFIISNIRSSLYKELQFYCYDTLEKFLNDKNITEEVKEMLNSEEKIDAIIMLKELIS